SVSYGGFHMGDMLYDVDDLREEATVRSIQSIDLTERISVIAPKLVGTIDIDDMPVAVVGVRWQQELGIKSYWAIEGTIPERDNQILLGANDARTLSATTGSLLTVFGSRYEVSGIIGETGGDDDQVVFMELGTLQSVLNKPDGVSFVEVAALCSGCPIDDIVGQIQVNLPGAEIKALQNIVNQRMESIHFVQNLALFISIIILITAATMVALSMLSAVNERKKDIGILRSLGYAKHQVFIIFCVEAGIIGVVSGVVGYLAGYGASFKALELLALAEDFQPVFSGLNMVLTALAFGGVTILAALYPAWKGAVIEPSEALVAL
ncbi:MAG TPA: FtsX-like permease family protein, partial [Desulfopila sp.]|nr:FtsX-like permease family protein [Desulfopila sp.]